MEVDPQTGASSDRADESPPAVRDAEAIASRIALDEAAADDERARLGQEPLRPVEPGPEATPYLGPTEDLLDSAAATLIAESPGRAGGNPTGRGRLLLTSDRLIHASEGGVRSVGLRDLAEAGVVGDRQLLIAVDDGRELRFDIDAPRVFRVRIAHVVAAERGARRR